METVLRTDLPDEARAAIAPLWKVFACAQDLKIDPWELALRLTHLVALGVDERDLRWLVLHGYVTVRDGARWFQRGARGAAGGNPRFMITETGLLAAGLRREGADCLPGGPSISARIVSLGCDLPRWDGKLRQLSFAGCVVKRFRLPARNQEAVLSAFEEEGWPPSIDDPLPFVPQLESKQRLRVTIRHLNENHRDRLIRFRGNGTGEAVLWEPMIAASAIDWPAATLKSRRAA
jgi:hypothetical protein